MWTGFCLLLINFLITTSFFSEKQRSASHALAYTRNVNRYAFIALHVLRSVTCRGKQSFIYFYLVIERTNPLNPQVIQVIDIDNIRVNRVSSFSFAVFQLWISYGEVGNVKVYLCKISFMWNIIKRHKLLLYTSVTFITHTRKHQSNHVAEYILPMPN